MVLDAGKFLTTLGPVWKRATAKERRDILRVIFEVVYVDLVEQKITGFVPKPAFSILLQSSENEKDLAQLCEVGERLYFQRKR